MSGGEASHRSAAALWGLDGFRLVDIHRLLLAFDESRRRKLTSWPSLFETLVHNFVGHSTPNVRGSDPADELGEEVAEAFAGGAAGGEDLRVVEGGRSETGGQVGDQGQAQHLEAGVAGGDALQDG